MKFSTWIIFSVLFAFLLGCSVVMNNPSLGTVSSCNTQVTTVTAAHSNAPDWNDYLNAQAGSTSVYHSINNIACVAGVDTACFHGGQVRKMILTDQSSCTGLSAIDSLGVFNWDCDASSGTATFYSVDFMPDKGLANLVDQNGWLSNQVTVTNGSDCSPYQSAASNTWWSNPVVDLSQGGYVNDTQPDAPVDLNTASTIYVLPSDQGTEGYNLNADKTALVTINGAKLSATSVDINCNQADGEITGADQTATVCSGGNNFIWVEGDFDRVTFDATESRSVYFVNSKYVRVRNTTVANGSKGLRFDSCSYGLIDDFKGQNTVSGTNEVVLTISGSDHLRFSRVVLGNSLTTGIYILTSNDISFDQVLIHNNDIGIDFQGGTDIFFQAVTVTQSLTSGMQASGGSGSITGMFNNMVIANNGTAIRWMTSTQNTFSNLAIAHATTHVNLDASSNSDYFTGYLSMDGAPTCNSSGTLPGLDGACTPTNGSNATVNPGGSIDFTNTFSGGGLGKVIYPGDTSNTTNMNGIQAYAVTNDFFNFESFWRSWGLDGIGAFPSGTNQGRCDGAATCRIWDFRPLDVDIQIYNRSNDGTTNNTPFESGGTCVSELDGNQIITDSQGRVFLQNAVELFGDAIGDDDGLCEDNESCLYTPHIGAYQGSGNYRSQSCAIADAILSNITVYAYPNL